MASSKSSEGGDSIDQSAGVTYEGSCHCKAVLYSVKLPSELPNLPVISCNCKYDPLYFHGSDWAKYREIGSYCHVSGSFHAFADDIEIRQGKEALKV